MAADNASPQEMRKSLSSPDLLIARTSSSDLPSSARRNEGAEEEPTESNEWNKENRQGLLKALTKAIGVDISSITVPVTLNEPCSFLMRLCESLQYSDLLDKAAQCDDSLERLMYIACFAISWYSCLERTGKPFNPLLGETYEYVDEKRENFQFIAEQVSHHPPVAACYAEATNWKYWQSQQLKTSFRGNSLDCQGLGSSNVFMKKTNEWFKWEVARTMVHNLIIGRMWIDHYGDLEITNKAKGEKAKLHFKPCGWFNKGWHEVDGEIYDSKGVACISIHGKWNEAIYAKMHENYKPKDLQENYSDDADIDSSTNNTSTQSSKEKKKEDEKRKKEERERKKQFRKAIKAQLSAQTPVWSATIKPVEKEKIECKYVNDWTPHTFQITAIAPQLEAILPPTDSRLRKDRYWLEKGDPKSASSEKHRLEEKQRAERRAREKTNEKWQPRYFRLATDSDGQEFWEYTGGYFEAREQRLKALSSATTTTTTTTTTEKQ